MAEYGYLHLIVFVTFIILFFRDVESAKAFTEVELCRETPGANETAYCRCKEHVIDCDFSPLKTEERYEIKIQGWNEPNNHNIKRLCFCGGPSKLHLFIAPNVFVGLRRLHRVDFHNIPGVIHLRDTMANYFSGDVYMNNVRVNTIHDREFGPADYFTIEDVSNLQCCSKIETAKNLSHPVLHIEDSRIGLIKINGIDDSHRWNSVILNKVYANVDKFGIFLTGEGTNVSITHCTFNETQSEAIVLRNTANVLLAGNTFSAYAHPLTLLIESGHPNSNLLMIENYFHNSTFIPLDAKKVIVWFNHFQRWDREEFYKANKTLNPGRVYAVQFNVFKTWTPGAFSDADAPAKTILFQENVLGPCDCSNDYNNASKIFLESRCEVANLKNPKQVCDPRIEHIGKLCKEHSASIKYDSVCRGENRLSASFRDYRDTMDRFFKTHNASLDSPFILYVIDRHMSRYNYEVTPIGMDEPQSAAARHSRDESLPRASAHTFTVSPSLLEIILLVTLFN